MISTALIAVTPQVASAASPVARCENAFDRATNVTSATGVFTSLIGTAGGLPVAMLPGTLWTCPAVNIDSGYIYYFGLDRYVIKRNSTVPVIDGIPYYTYDVTQYRRDCACTVYNVAGTAKWQVTVPYHYVPRLATNSGVLSDALYVTRNGVRSKLADLKFNLSFVEDPIGKLQRGYFSELSVALASGTPTAWSYTTSKTQGQACTSYPETVGSKEVWYLRCDVDVTFVDATKQTTGVELQAGGEIGKENAKFVGGVALSNSSEQQGSYVYYKLQIKIALGITWYSLVRRTGDCKQMSLSYVISVLNPYTPGNVSDSWAVHGGRCRLNSSLDY